MAAPSEPATAAASAAATASLDDLLRLDVRVGTVVRAEPFPEARKPAYRLWVDLGPGHGVRRSSAQVVARYAPADLVGRQVLAVANLPPRRVAGFESEVLVLGVPDAEGAVVLLRPDAPVPDGGRMY